MLHSNNLLRSFKSIGCYLTLMMWILWRTIIITFLPFSYTCCCTWWIFYKLCLISWPSIRDWRYADIVKTMNCQQININRSNLHYFNLVSIQFIPISCLWLKPQTKERDNFIFSICWMYMFRLSHIFACSHILICTVYKSSYNWLDS